MTRSEIEQRIRDHFSSEVGRVQLAAPRAVARREVPAWHRWLGYLAAAAAVALVPVLMIVGQPTQEQLALAIQVQWDTGGREKVRRLLREAGHLLAFEEISQEEEK